MPEYTSPPMRVELLLDNDRVIRELAEDVIIDQNIAESIAAYIRQECVRLRAEGATWVTISHCKSPNRVRVEAAQPV